MADTLTLKTTDFPRGTSYVLWNEHGTAVYRTFSYTALCNWLKRHGYRLEQ